MSTDETRRLPVRNVPDMAIAGFVRLPMPSRRRGELWCFRVSMRNNSTGTICLRGRKWVMSYANGEQRVVEATQVFNCRPVLERGAVFSFGGEMPFPTPPERVELRLFGEDQLRSPFMTPPLVFPQRNRLR